MPTEEFRTLVNDYGARVLSTAVRILGDADKAQDVHQEVFLAIWKRWHTYNGRTNWDAYLYRATVRKAIELARRSRNESLLKRQAPPSAGSGRPDARLRVSEFQQKLAGRLAQLPKRQAEVFVLSKMENLKAERIAELLGCSRETVRVHLHRALKRLSRELGDDLTE
ncbi:MAG: sigma-70 family RNA polymerase sigma factor [Phycisphaerales bacterium]|nr:MAG: sigma-70 family RNA polymerase sigma factor [Phycisphaerales bacterium]